MFVAAVGLASLATTGCGRAAMASPTPVEVMATNDVAACTLGNGAFMSAAELGQPYAFDRFLDEDVTTVPLRGGTAQTTGNVHTATATFYRGHAVGYLADFTVAGSDRQSEDTYASSLGYKPGRWPLVPFVGAVVTSHTGVLEVYEETFVFSSADGASAYRAIILDSAKLLPGARRVSWAASGADATSSYAIVTVPPPASPQVENSVWLIAQWGGVLTRVSVQGGAAVSFDTAESVGSTAMAHLHAQCARQLNSTRSSS